MDKSFSKYRLAATQNKTYSVHKILRSTIKADNPLVMPNTYTLHPAFKLSAFESITIFCSDRDTVNPSSVINLHIRDFVI